jgi:hypothetical protein
MNYIKIVKLYGRVYKVRVSSHIVRLKTDKAHTYKSRRKPLTPKRNELHSKISARA